MTLKLTSSHGGPDSRVLELANDVAARLAAEPDLDDFLAWTAGTLEYWVHIVAASVGRRRGWASQTEVPYMTAAPNPGTKSNVKWADGAMLFDDLGVLLEVKTIAARHGVAGPTLRKVPNDFAALAALDWSATLRQSPDQYSGIIWAERRAVMHRVCLLQLALIHAPLGQLPARGSVPTAIRAAAVGVSQRLEAQRLDDAAALVQQTFATEPVTYALRGLTHEGELYAWSANALRASSEGAQLESASDPEV